MNAVSILDKMIYKRSIMTVIRIYKLHVPICVSVETGPYWVKRKRGSRNMDHDFDTESHAIIITVDFSCVRKFRVPFPCLVIMYSFSDAQNAHPQCQLSQEGKEHMMQILDGE